MTHAPHSSVAEQSLLGMLMADNDLFALIDGRITPDDFYVPLHAAAFGIIQKLERENLDFAPPTVVPKLVDKFGTEAELYPLFVQMYESAGNMRNIASVAHVVSEYALQRKLINAAKELTLAANGNDVEKAIQWQKEVASLAKGFTDFVPETTKAQVVSAINAAHNKTKMMATNLGCWDRIFGGIFREKIYTISGYGGAGKSALAVNIAWNMACHGYKVRWVSWEEDREALWCRILSRECGIDSKKIREGSISEGESAALHNKGMEIMGADFLAYYKLKDQIQIIDACGKCDLIVVDGLSRFPCTGASIIDRVQDSMKALGEISLKTGAAILLLAHVNGDSVKNGAGISSVYGGQVATFDPEGIVDIRRSDDIIHDGGKRSITLTVIKNRYGPEGIKVPMWFEGMYQRFYEQERGR